MDQAKTSRQREAETAAEQCRRRNHQNLSAETGIAPHRSVVHSNPSYRRAPGPPITGDARARTSLLSRVSRETTGWNHFRPNFAPAQDHGSGKIQVAAKLPAGNTLRDSHPGGAMAVSLFTDRRM